MQTWRPPAQDADRCDVCGRRGIARFTPFELATGPLVLCGECAATILV
jgi:hypothetical protein